MNSGPTAERVYDALKRRIMDHEFRPGSRLDPTVLAHSLSSSVTPVRDALHILTGEGLVEARVSDGFHLPSLDEPGLKDLYAWTNEVLGLAAKSRGGLRHSPAAAVPADATPIADRTAALFAQIGAESTNIEHGRAIRSLNARTHPVRVVEPHIIGDVEAELDAIDRDLATGDASTLRRLIDAYHRRRHRAAGEILRVLYRGY